MATGPLLHVDADAFFASVALRSRPELVGVPVAVTAHVFVASANYPARARGVRGGMSLDDARRHCPELVLLDSPRAEIEEVGDALFDLFHETAGAVEPGSIEEAFLDVGAEDWPTAIAAGQALRMRVAAELGISVSVGIGRTKLMAKLASRAAKPAGLHVIGPTEEGELRRTLPLAEVWGVGSKTAERLGNLGATRLEDVDRFSDETLQHACGTTMARRLRAIRTGTDDTTVRTVESRSTLSTEASTSGYARPDHTLDEMIEACVARLARRAERAGLAGTGLTVALHPSGDAPPVRRACLGTTATTGTASWLAIAHGLLDDVTAPPLAGVRVSLTGLRPVSQVAPMLF
ncbi:DNA polymerase IV [Plantibacter flavus]|uniref:Y-family DNA polymerase n=1 Tax=Plantibacter flavus TaxID=150123 RepID=UPI003F16D7CF